LLLLVVEITPARAGDHSTWIELRSPHFIVVTNAGEGKARATAHQFEMIRAVFRKAFGKKGESAELPLTILAAKDESTLKAILPEYWVRRGAMHPAGVYLGGSDADYIALRVDVSLNNEADEPFEPVYHEYVHYLTRRMIARLPLWLVEGLAEFYGNTRIESKKVYVGRYSSSNLRILSTTPLLPVSTLFNLDASSPYYREQDKASIFYAQSWALTHYLFTRDWKENTHRTGDFMALVASGKNEEEAAAQTIGAASTLDQSLQKYTRSLTFAAAVLEPPSIDESTFKTRDMSDAEALAVRADFMAHDRHYAEAQQMLEEALKADPRLGIAYEGLSFLALQQGKVEDAEKWSAQAVALNPESYRANYYCAWSLIKGGHHDEASLAKAEGHLRAAQKSNPEYVPAYDAMAYVLELEGGKEKLAEAYMNTLQATQREPGNVHYRIRSVEVLERQGRPSDAVTVATLAASMAKTPEERAATASSLAQANQFQESWEKMKAAGITPVSGKEGVTGVIEEGGFAEGGAESGGSNETPRLAREVHAEAGIQVIGDTGGVDFGPYLNQEVMPRIQKAWYDEVMTMGVNAAESKGRVVVEFAIAKDGSVAGLKMKESTNSKALDDAVRDAIDLSIPFAPLPAKFRGKELALRFQCDYTPDIGAGDRGKSTQK
jgi:TonB family protein